LAQLPRALLSHAAEQGARQLRLILPADIHVLKFEEPPDADPEETHTALAYEAADELGQEAHLVRIAWMPAEDFRLGADPDDVLVAGFDLEYLTRYARDCQAHDLVFAGVVPLELACLGLLVDQQADDRRLVLLRHSSGFYATPSLAVAPMAVGALPVGASPDADSARDEERIQRTARRLHAHEDLPVFVLSCGPLDDSAKNRLLAAIGVKTSVAWSTLENELPALGALAMRGSTEANSQGCPVVGLPPAPRDPYRAGTWLFWIIILSTVLYVGLRVHALDEEKLRLSDRKARWEELVKARTGASSAVESVRAERDRLIATHRLLTETKPLDPVVVPLLDTLGSAIPAYTCLARVAATEAGSYEVRGYTLWQEGLAELEAALNRTLSPFGYRARPGQIVLQEERNEQEFIFFIQPLGGNQ
jgi:hypothetical protein